MTQKEYKEVISKLIKEIKIQKKVIMDSVQSPNMTEIELNYYKAGLENGIDVVIDILKEEK
jgi:hypothetical protein